MAFIHTVPEDAAVDPASSGLGARDVAVVDLAGKVARDATSVADAQ